jgi:hypothetical protein
LPQPDDQSSACYQLSHSNIAIGPAIISYVMFHNYPATLGTSMGPMLSMQMKLPSWVSLRSEPSRQEATRT